MNGNKVEFIDPNGNIIPHWDEAANISVDTSNIEEVEGNEKTVQEVIEDLYSRPSSESHSDDPDSPIIINGDAGIIGSGTFQEAYNTASSLQDITTMFTWLLVDTDENDNTIRKIIWHIGNHQFIDALGAEIIGSLSGLTVTS